MSMSEPTPTFAFFRMKARMMRMLGEDLIRDNTVGLMELVKNGYDADAQEVLVALNDLHAPESTTIIVQDDGYGMSEETIKGPWMEPAHGGKEHQKRQGMRTPLGRLPLGEKGVGRFAVQKLGKYLELVTRPPGETVEFVMVIDWSKFETDEYLDEIPLQITPRIPLVFTGETHGTRLTMRGAREKWTKDQVQRFQASLIRLLSPVNAVEHFSVQLSCPEYPHLESLEPDDILKNYQYRIDCLVDSDGMADFEYRSQLHGQEEMLISKKEPLWSQIQAKRHSDRPFECGPFFIQMSAWLLDDLKAYNLDREQLRILAGVSIYRDGFRILPYGDEGDDWLGLDKRRINVPGKRFGNQQVVGIVEITQGINRELGDKTNREGLKENQAYYDFRDLVLGVIELFEMQSLEQRKSANPSRKTRRDLVREVSTLEKQVRDLQERSLTQIDPLTTPYETAEESGKQQSDSTTADVQSTTPVEVLTEQASPVQQSIVPVSREELTAIVEQTESIQAGLREFDETEDADSRAIYLHLMGLGLAAERFAHEFDRMVDSALRSIQALQRGSAGNKDAIDHLNIFVNALRNELRLMGTLSYVRRKQSAQQHSVRRIIDLILQVHEQEIKDASIQVEYAGQTDFEVYISEASLAQVIGNIVDNAIYWLTQKAEVRDRKLKIELVAIERAIFISNNGPSVTANIPRRLFKEPFVSAKIGGRGLGMYIASEILKPYNGQIVLMNTEDSRVLSGAAFAVQFVEQEKR